VKGLETVGEKNEDLGRGRGLFLITDFLMEGAGAIINHGFKTGLLLKRSERGTISVAKLTATSSARSCRRDHLIVN